VSNHEKRLLRCVKDLATEVANGEGLEFDNEFWIYKVLGDILINNRIQN